MKKSSLLMTTALSTAFLFSVVVPAFAEDSITGKTVSTSNAPISSEAVSDPRVAAQNFVAHINYARVALAMKNGDLAQRHVTQARNMIAVIMNGTMEQRRIAHVEAGRVVYEYNTIHKYNYFPVEAGQVEVKHVSDGPLWAKNDLAVSDAEIVTLSLDLTNDKAETYLTEAEADIKSGKLSDAQDKLGELTDAVVSVDDKIAMPIDKAHDNIGIAQNFIRGRNYDGARYALGHADDALDAMQKDDVYKNRRTEIIAMRKEVNDMRDVITKKDPTMLQKAGTNVNKWMTDLKSWAKK